jgi:hypothetical protein
MSVSKKILDIDQNLPTKDGKGGFAFPFRSHPQTASIKKVVKHRQTFSPSCPKKGGKGGESGRQTFSLSCPKKGGKGGESGRQTFSPSCPKKGGKGGETGFTAFTTFFPASLKKCHCAPP